MKFVKNIAFLMMIVLILTSCFACAKKNNEPTGGSDSTEYTFAETLDESDRPTENDTEKFENSESCDTDAGESADSSDSSAGEGEMSESLNDNLSEATETSSEKDETEDIKETDKTEETDSPEIEGFEKSAEISDNGGIATVNTADGLKYSAKGYSSIESGKFVFGDQLTVSFDDLDGEFNRITLCYVSTAPMKCTFKYTENGAEKTDSFFLEAGENIFSGLIESYLEGDHAVSLKEACFEPLAGGDAELMIYNAVCSERKVYNANTYYLENERFKVGLRLIWGGGITFIQDKSCPVDKLGNMINIHDAGRLVQQSYYGTAGNDEYKPGVYNGTDWVYNPVQGGDQNWNKSRLIDIIVSENSVYIKAQPQDWSLDGDITPSYMENVYAVYDDRIVVDNRFVDFSGWEHRFAHQELPAFYTVSYLDRFSYYNGLSPWSGDGLISHDNLPFCGGEEKAQCYFKLLESNTETWCAWTNADDDYGIGLYLPGADMLLAGRFEDGSSKNPKDNSCSYVAPVNTLKIQSFVPIEYSYMITAGSIDEMRAVFNNNRDFADNAFLSSEYSKSLRLPDVNVSFANINFSTAEHNKYLDPMNSATVKFNSDHNAVELSVNGADPQVNIPYIESENALSAKDYNKIVIEYMVPKTNSSLSGKGELFLCTGNTVNAEGGKSVAVNYICDGAYHTLEIDLSQLDFWNGNINAIRFDFFNEGESGDTLFVKNIKLVK